MINDTNTSEENSYTQSSRLPTVQETAEDWENNISSQTEGETSLLEERPYVPERSTEVCSFSETQFNPRRRIGNSSFKGHNSKANLVEVSLSENEAETGVENEVGIKYADAPEQVEHLLTQFRIQWNSGGGSCLFKAAAQHVNATGVLGSELSYLNLRYLVHRKLIENWVYFEEFYSFPMDFTIGSGNKSRSLTILSADRFKEFLSGM